jgi:hypothetical protein
MQLKPFEDEPQSPLRKPTRNDAIQDSNGDVVLAVGSVEMRGIVLAVKDRDHDAEETADFRHERILPEGKARLTGTRPSVRPERVRARIAFGEGRLENGD